MGYARKGSKASLLAGLTFGGILLGSGYMIAKTENIYEGHLLASGTSGLMAAAMAQRFMSTGKFVPAGLVAIIGAGACAYNIQKAREWAPSKEGTLSLSSVAIQVLSFFLSLVSRDLATFTLQLERLQTHVQL